MGFNLFVFLMMLLEMYSHTFGRDLPYAETNNAESSRVGSVHPSVRLTQWNKTEIVFRSLTAKCVNDSAVKAVPRLAKSANCCHIFFLLISSCRMRFNPENILIALCHGGVEPPWPHPLSLLLFIQLFFSHGVTILFHFYSMIFFLSFCVMFLSHSIRNAAWSGRCAGNLMPFEPTRLNSNMGIPILDIWSEPKC